MKQYNLKMMSAVPADWSGIERAYVDSYVWGGAERAYKTYGQLAYAKTDDENAGLYIHLFCEEKDPVSKEKQLDGMVCMDSCMEFFFGMHQAGVDDIHYLNIESNSLGVTFMSFGEGRHGRVFLNEMGIERFPVSVNIGEDGWEVFVFVPEKDLKKIFRLSEIDETTVMKGNFYKLCDGKRPHYGSFCPADFTDINPLGSRYFGDFELALY